MKNSDKKQYYIIIQETGEKVPVTEEVYREFYNSQNRERYALTKLGQCHCPHYFIWRCNCDCDVCPYFSKPRAVSSADDENDDKFTEPMAVDKIDIEIETDTKLLLDLVKRLAEIYPDSEKIITMKYQGYTGEEISKKINTPRKTYESRLKAALKKLGVNIDDYK